MHNKIEDIVEQLIEARKAYYESDTPLMTDADFDVLEDDLRRLDPENEYFATVGIAESEGSTAKIRHEVPMLSMGKAKTLDEVEKWLRRLALSPDAALTVQPKVDGLSASLRYERGHLVYAATRGDGETGQDISHVVPYIGDIPKAVSFTEETVEIRGELHLPRDTPFDTGGKPLRNNCVGLINRKEERDDLKYVRFLAYQILWPGAGHLSSGGTAGGDSAVSADARFASEGGKIDILAENGFYTFRTWKIAADLSAEHSGVPEGGDRGKGAGGLSSDRNAGAPADTSRTSSKSAQGELFGADEDSGDVSADPPDEPAFDYAAEMMIGLGRIYDEYIGELRDEWNFETDGLIIIVDDNRLHDGIDERWVVDHHHHYAVAFKPPSQAAQTVLKDVVWQVSRQGNLTPVAVFEPLRMGGATLERASLHNAANVRRLKLAFGDTILVERANDVIPYVRGNLSAGDVGTGVFPAACPSCGSKPVEMGVNLICPNPDCRDRVLQSILFWVRQSGMEQIALRTLEALYDAGKLRNIHDLYNLGKDDFEGLEGFGEKKITNFLNQAAETKTMSAVELISRLGIPMVQKKSLTRLGIAAMDDFWNFSDESYVIGRRIIEWKAEPGNREFLDEILSIVTLRDDEIPKDRRGVICLTGKAPVPRKPLAAVLEARGWIVADAVTNDTVKVVCDNPGGTSTKLKKAREKGLEIVTYEDFFNEEKLEF